MATYKDCLHFNDCLSYGKTRYYGENSACNNVQERRQYFKNKENFAESIMSFCGAIQLLKTNCI